LFRRRCRDPEDVGDFVEGEQSTLAKALVAWREVVVIADTSHHHDVHRLACSRAKPSLGEDASDLDVRVIREEAVNLRDDFGTCLA
jgi:hypothetical protein